MPKDRPYTQALEKLRGAGLRPTRQRLALAKLLFEGRDRHVTAEQVHDEARTAEIRVSLATVYNTLHQFTEAGLMREVMVEPGRSYFDTNTDEHHHFFVQGSGELRDIAADVLSVDGVPEAPDGTEIERIDVIVRVKSSEN